MKQTENDGRLGEVSRGEVDPGGCKLHIPATMFIERYGVVEDASLTSPTASDGRERPPLLQ